MPGGEPLAVRNATRQDVRYPPRRCPSGPSPQRGARAPERHQATRSYAGARPARVPRASRGYFCPMPIGRSPRRASRRRRSARAARLPVPRFVPAPCVGDSSRALRSRRSPPLSPRRPLPPVTQRIPTRPPRWPTPGSTPPTPRIGRRSTCVSPTPTITASRILPRRAPHPRASSPVFDPPGASP